jgi:hypothetical protein
MVQERTADGRGTPELPRENTPVDEALPGAGTVVPAGPPDDDEALGAPAPPEAVSGASSGGPAMPPRPASGSPGDPLPGGGRVVPVGDLPDDEALGVPVPAADDEPSASRPRA